MLFGKVGSTWGPVPKLSENGPPFPKRTSLVGDIFLKFFGGKCVVKAFNVDEQVSHGNHSTVFIQHMVSQPWMDARMDAMRR